MLAILVQLSACGAGSGLKQAEVAIDRMMHVSHEHPMDHFVIVWRFVEYSDSEPAMEYVGGPALDELPDPHSRTVTSRYIKGLARLIGPHEDGVYRVQVTHLDDVLGEAEFELTNCENRS